MIAHILIISLSTALVYNASSNIDFDRDSKNNCIQILMTLYLYSKVIFFSKHPDQRY